MTFDEMCALPEAEQKRLFTALKLVRQVYKKVNYTAVYGSGAATLARAAGVTKSRGEELKDAYWKRNWSVLKIAEEQEVKKCLGGMWLFNPVSELWYSLRYEKDRFSTLNQGTGVWAFDKYVENVRTGGPPLCAQFHDEWVATVRADTRDRLKLHCQKAIDKTNAELKLNRELDFSIDFGKSYADIH